MDDEDYKRPSLSGVQVDATLMRSIIQGSATATVQTANGPVPSVAKRLAEAAARINYTTKADLAELRNYGRESGVGLVYLLGHALAGDGGGGAYYLDVNDTVTTDDGVSVVVGSDDARWKRLQDNWPVNVIWFGAKRSAGAATNKAALDAAIAFADSQGGGAVLVPSGINYGYQRNFPATHPDFSSIINDIVVTDYGSGDSYNSPSRDGAQIKYFMGTARGDDGLHDGNFHWIRGGHHPGLMISNDRTLDGSHADLNATVFFAHAGVTTWGIGQGGNSGPTTQPDDLTDFKIIANKLAGGPGLTNVLRIAKDTGKIGWNTSNPVDAFSIDCLPTMGGTFRLRAISSDPTVALEDRAGDIAQMRMSSGNLQFVVGTSKWMEVQDDGRVFAGNATAPVGGFTMQYDMPGGQALFAHNTSTSINSSAAYFWSATSDTTTRLMEGRGGNSQVFRVYGNGTVENGTGTYASLSDARLKQNIEDAPSQWDDVKSLRLRKYRWRDCPDDPPQLGVVAQEVREVCPGLVMDDGERLTVKTSVMLTKAMGALQEAMTRIETLEDTVAKQAAQIRELQGR